MSLKKFSEFKVTEFKEQWDMLQTIPNVFAYKLNVNKRKYVPGDFNFYTELNVERTFLRRTPDRIESVNPVFDEEKFNFTKIKKEELLMKLAFENIEVSLIINKSPLSSYHTLICPDVDAKLGQRLTFESLCFCMALMQQLQRQDRLAYRIGYNSPGALASVNHLHLHLLYLDVDLYVDMVPIQPITFERKHICRINSLFPTEGICFLIYNNDTADRVRIRIREIYEFIMWLCEQNIPHNLIITPERCSGLGVIKFFIFARQHYCTVKDLNQFNLGFCELIGFIPVGDNKLFDEITEREILIKIIQESGDVYSAIYDYLSV